MNGRNRDAGNRKIIAMPGLKKDDPIDLKKKRIDDKNRKLAEAILDEEFDAVPSSQEVRTAESIETDTRIDIPINLIRPMTGRIFCKEMPAFEKKTKAGIILAKSYEQYRGEEKIIRDYKRYFVIDVANDLTRTFKPMKKEEPERKLRRGDEVYIAVPEESSRPYSPVYVIDWNNGAMKYIVFEEMEITGAGLIDLIAEQDPVEIKKKE